MKNPNDNKNVHIPPYGELDTETVRDLVAASLMSFPPPWRTKKLAMMLAESLKDQRTQRMLRGSPRKMLALAGIEVPESVKIDVHETTSHNLHLMLPHPLMTIDASNESASPGDQVDLSDDDLVTGSKESETASNDWNTGDWFTDPKSPDLKSDTKVGGLVGDFGNFFRDNDADAATVADKGD